MLFVILAKASLCTPGTYFNNSIRGLYMLETLENSRVSSLCVHTNYQNLFVFIIHVDLSNLNLFVSDSLIKPN